MNYREHWQQWHDCDKCDLSKVRFKVVLARGRIPCHFLFVGEAPGYAENVLGRPFVGPSGKLLDRLLVDAQIPPESYCITNLVACIPLDQSGKKISQPPERAIQACRPRLEQMIQLANPKCIIAVGRIAQSELRGFAKHSIIHPAAILRMEDERREKTITATVKQLIFIRQKELPDGRFSCVART